MRRLPKPSSDEKNLHVVIQSTRPPLYAATVPSHLPSAVANVCAAGASPGWVNHVRLCSSAGSCSCTIVSRSPSMICQRSSYTGLFFLARYLPTSPLTHPASAPMPVPALTPEPCPMYVSFSLPSVIEEMSIAYSLPDSSSATSFSPSVAVMDTVRCRAGGGTRPGLSERPRIRTCSMRRTGAAGWMRFPAKYE